MENLFKYAKKELSQDAFLLWTLSHACSEDKAMREFSRNFISFLTGRENKDLNIEKIELKPQWEKVDILAEITLKSGENINIFIEDKTGSNEHNQLVRYNEKIAESKKYSSEKCVKIFYKIDMINADERQRVDEAGWKIIELDQLHNFWKDYCSSQNLVVKMYASRIVEMYNAFTTEDVPREYPNDRRLEMFEREDLRRLMWKGFFYKIISGFFDKCDARIIMTKYKYIALQIWPKGKKLKERNDIPYIEIRDRDCREGKFKALILTYGMAENRKRIDKWNAIQKAGEGTVFNKKESRTKQVLSTKPTTYKGYEDFLKLTEKCIEDYLKIMEVTGYIETVSNL